MCIFASYQKYINWMIFFFIISYTCQTFILNYRVLHVSLSHYMYFFLLQLSSKWLFSARIQKSSTPKSVFLTIKGNKKERICSRLDSKLKGAVIDGTSSSNFKPRLIQIGLFILAFNGQNTTLGVEILWILVEDSHFDNCLK